jgi:TetR/AcrR family tetracycline transcriptional repressor
MSIQPDAVIAKALELLDETGLDGLSMRRLADALDIKAASLYWHFANKQALLDGMADALMSGVATSAPVVGQPWQERLADVAGEMRRALLARRDGARVFAGTYVPTENVMRVGEALMAPLREAGADAKLASWGAFSVMYFLLGFVIEESGVAPEQMPGPELEQRAKAFEQMSARFPNLAAGRDAIFDNDFGARFRFGLDLMLAGLAGKLAAAA